METQKIINLGKEIIYIAGYYKNYSSDEKIKLERKFKFYKENLAGSKNIYSKKLIEFLDDLLGDLSRNHPLQIDNIFEDDFIGHYYDAFKQSKFYNSLIDFEIYKEIILNKNFSKNNELFLKFFSNFKENFKNLNSENISYLLLIFTTFDLISPKKYLKRLFDFRKKYGLSFRNIERLKTMMKTYENFLNDLFRISLKNLKYKNFAYKYIKIQKIGEEKDFELKFILEDSSKDKFRTGNPIYEYREIIRNLEK